MKRIVKQVEDWRKPGSEVIIDNRLQAYRAKIVHVKEDIDEILCKSDNMEFYCRMDGTNYCNDNDIVCRDQITFEQAFKEWKENPIAFINKEVKTICYLAQVFDPTRFTSITTNGCVLESLSINSMKKLFETFKTDYYQASSWHDLHMNVIPTLMKMAQSKQ